MDTIRPTPAAALTLPPGTAVTTAVRLTCTSTSSGTVAQSQWPGAWGLGLGLGTRARLDVHQLRRRHERPTVALRATLRSAPVALLVQHGGGV